LFYPAYLIRILGVLALMVDLIFAMTLYLLRLRAQQS
jgi:hypothetical protein